MVRDSANRHRGRTALASDPAEVLPPVHRQGVGRPEAHQDIGLRLIESEFVELIDQSGALNEQTES